MISETNLRQELQRVRMAVKRSGCTAYTIGFINGLLCAIGILNKMPSIPMTQSDTMKLARRLQRQRRDRRDTHGAYREEQLFSE